MEALVRRGEELTYCDWLGKPVVDEENSFFRRCSLKREREVSNRDKDDINLAHYNQGNWCDFSPPEHGQWLVQHLQTERGREEHTS